MSWQGGVWICPQCLCVRVDNAKYGGWYCPKDCWEYKDETHSFRTRQDMRHVSEFESQMMQASGDYEGKRMDHDPSTGRDGFWIEHAHDYNNKPLDTKVIICYDL